MCTGAHASMVITWLSWPVFQLSELQDAMGLSVQVWGADVIQGVVLERGWGRVNLEWHGMGRAMSGGRANGADPLGWRL